MGYIRNSFERSTDCPPIRRPSLVLLFPCLSVLLHITLPFQIFPLLASSVWQNFPLPLFEPTLYGQGL